MAKATHNTAPTNAQISPDLQGQSNNQAHATRHSRYAAALASGLFTVLVAGAGGFGLAASQDLMADGRLFFQAPTLLEVR